MTRHVESCRQKEVDSETSSSGQSARKSDVFHLVVEGRYAPECWMHLEVPADATLEVLDRFLRDIWLECCGHMSMFSIQDQRYSVAPMADFDDKSMNIRLDAVLSPGIKFCHEYDFGSTTHLTLKVVSQEQKQIKSRDIVILARNEASSYPCMSCGKTAAHVCTECMWAGDGCLCDKCVAGHKCGEEMLLPLVNSPRAGVCGYTGR
jgi:predicted RNA-binding Zn-ribbon protein involved in translation (DUF1610 family)